jgi:hypothetical protein
MLGGLVGMGLMKLLKWVVILLVCSAVWGGVLRGVPVGEAIANGATKIVGGLVSTGLLIMELIRER